MQLIPASANARIVSFLLSAIAGVACGGSTIAEISGDAGSGGNDGGTTSDAGGGCPSPPPPGHCLGACGEPGGSMQCIGGSWTCPPAPGISCDAGKANVGPITCGASTCDGNTEYCDIRGGGVPLPDAGSNVSSVCLPLPAMPCEAGTGCDCIENRCSCTDDAGAITNACYFP